MTAMMPHGTWVRVESSWNCVRPVMRTLHTASAFTATGAGMCIAFQRSLFFCVRSPIMFVFIEEFVYLYVYLETVPRNAHTHKYDAKHGGQVACEDCE